MFGGFLGEDLVQDFSPYWGSEPQNITLAQFSTG